MQKQFTLIELMIVIAIIAIIAAIAIPNLLEARKHANEASAIGSMKTINASEVIFLEKSGADVYADLGELEASGYLDNVLGSGTKQGYVFVVRVGDSLTSLNTFASDPAYEYSLEVAPANAPTTGDRRFYSSQAGVILFGPAAAATGSNVLTDPSFKPIGGK